MKTLAILLALLTLAACSDKKPSVSETPAPVISETPKTPSDTLVVPGLKPGDVVTPKQAVEKLETMAAVAGQEAAKAAPAMGDPKFIAREGWVEEKSTSNMRKAQFRLPKAGSDADDAEVVIFWFGGDGGGVEANLQRWEGQFTGADNAPVMGKLSDFSVKGRRVDLIELAGTWAGSMGVGAGPNKAMVGAVIENEKGLYFARLVGGQETVAKWKASYLDFLKAVY